MHRSIFMQVPDFSSVSRIIQNQQKKNPEMRFSTKGTSAKKEEEMNIQ